MGKSSPSPDASAVMAAQASVTAANNEYKFGEDQLNFEKQQWATDQPLIQQVANSDITAQNNQNAFSKTQQDAYTNTFLPLSEKYASQAQNWDTPAQEQANAGAAQASVATQFAGARNAAMAQLEGFGVDPSSTRYAALDIGTRAQQGAAQAGAGTQAINNTRLQGMGLEQSAIQAGQGIAGQSVGSTNAATGAGAGSSGATLGGLTAGAQAMSAPTAWYNSGANNMNAYSTAVNGFNLAQNQAAQINNQSMEGLGSIGGLLLGKMFDSGGPVPGMGSGALPLGPNTPDGHVPMQASPSMGQAPDDVPAKLTAGEFVVPKDVVNWMGVKHFVGQIDSARKGQQELSQRQDIGGRPGALPIGSAPRPQQSRALPLSAMA